MEYSTYIFDLDGTLLNTLKDLAGGCNYALRTNGMRERTLDEVRQFVGNGVRLLMTRAIPGGEQNPKFEKTFQDFKDYYLKHGQDKTSPYPGIMDLLRRLHDQGKKVGVVSNKFDAATKELCQHYFGSLVDIAIGEHESEGIRKKPAPDTVMEALRVLGSKPEEAVYIGDSDVDIDTARNSGMPCISVLWGFRDRQFLLDHGAQHLVSEPKEIAN